MERIQLFEVPLRTFETPQHFRQYLASEFEPAEILHNLTVMAGLTELTPSEFETELVELGFTVEQRYGAVSRLSFRMQEGLFETYLTHDVEPLGVVIFYSNFRKTEELRILQDALVFLPKTYRLFLRPVLIQSLLDHLLSDHASLRILDFTAKRSLGSRTPARLRPEAGRTIRYWGPDGREVLNEISHAYGVVPMKLRIEIPDIATFSIDNSGSFTFFRGNIANLLDVLKVAIEGAVADAKLLKKAHFQLYPVSIPGEDFRVPISTPADISLEISLDFDQALTVLSKLEEYDFVPYNSSAEEGSVFVKSDVLDLRTSQVFRFRADERRLRILPTTQESFQSLLRFYEFVLEEVDARAELAT